MVNVKYLKKDVGLQWKRKKCNEFNCWYTDSYQRETLQHHSPTHLALTGLCADIRQGLLQGENCTFIRMLGPADTELCKSWPQGDSELTERRDTIQTPGIYRAQSLFHLLFLSSYIYIYAYRYANIYLLLHLETPLISEMQAFSHMRNEKESPTVECTCKGKAWGYNYSYSFRGSFSLLFSLILTLKVMLLSL